MSIQIERIPLSVQLGAEELRALEGLLESSDRVTLIVPDFGVRDACRRALADAGCGVGIDVTTPDGWIQSLWELMGDGRRIVSGAQRRLLATRSLLCDREEGSMRGEGAASAGSACGEGMASARGAQSEVSAPVEHAAEDFCTPGMIKMIARAARLYLPYIERRADRATCSASERRIVRALERYARSLQDLGLIEGSSAAAVLSEGLAERLPACAGAVVLRGVHELPEYLLELIGAVASGGTVRIVLELEAAAEAEALAQRFGVAAHGVAALAQLSAGDASRPGIPLRFAEVCGPSAREAAYGLIVSAAAREARGAESACPAPAVAVAAPDPAGMFRDLAPRLAAQGIASSLEVRLAFRDTRAGQAVAALSDFLERVNGEEASAWWPAPEIPDWIRSPFSGLASGAPRIARMLDTRLRKTRSLTKKTLLRELDSLQSRELNRERELAERSGRERRPIAVKAVVDALDDGAYSRAFQLMAACASSAPLAAFGAEGLAAKQMELAALEAAQAFMDEARELGVAESQAYLALPELTVRYAQQLAPRSSEGECPDGSCASQAQPTVAFRSLDALASSTPASSAVAFLLDADASSYPLAERDTPLTLLAEKLGCAGISAQPAERQRVRFRHAAESAQVAVFGYVANDRQAEERYPALAYAEAKAAAGERGQGACVLGLPLAIEGAAAALDGAPAPCAAAMRALDALDCMLGKLPNEGALFANLDLAGGVGARRDAVGAAGEHSLAPELNRFLLLPERSLGSRTVPRTLSASQIENYLACPYRWLVSNRAATRRLDVGFGPIEMGNFVHDVMQRFHERLIDEGLMRVRPETVDACLVQMDQAFIEIRADHLRGKYTYGKYAREERPRAIRGPLVPLDELERNRLDAMLSKLHEVVRYEADMLSIFTPSQFEYSFDKEGVTYAGRALGGRIDRIDTAEDAGFGERFVVIDYKNRASVRELGCPDPTMMLDEGEELPQGWLPGRDADRAPKVQTLIYAQALEHLGAGSAQGAVYFATRGPEVAGAVADSLTASEPPAFPHDAVSGYPGVKPPRSRTAKHDGFLKFKTLLDTVEEGVARELDALEAGAIAPRPAADSCSFCPLTMCEKRR